MGPWGALIMGFFGAGFFVTASVQEGGWRNPLIIAPVVVFAGLALTAWRMIAAAAPSAYSPSPAAAKVISRATMFEAIGVPVVAMGLANTGHGALVMPGVAAVVGLHFIPMGWAIPFRPFFGLAVVILAASCVGFVLPQPTGSMVAGFVSALALWTASVLALRRGRAVT
jgi:hypothetical protein